MRPAARVGTARVGISKAGGPQATRRARASEAEAEPVHFTLLASFLGELALVWRGSSVLGLLLPEASARETKRRVLLAFPTAKQATPSGDLARAVQLLAASLRGEAVSLNDIPVDLEHVTPFQKRVYEATRRVAFGETRTYGDLAKQLGVPGGARAIGGALGKNPIALIIPCHRVLGGRGALTGFTAPGGVGTKAKLLEYERSLMAAHPGEPPPARRKSAQAGPPKAAPPKSAPPKSVQPKPIPSKLIRTSQAVSAPPIVRPKPASRGRSFEAAYLHLRRDRKLAKVMDWVGEFDQRLQKTSSVFEALARAIVHQQLSGRAAETIWGRFVGLFASAGVSPEAVLKAPKLVLRSAGLSESKALSVLDLAARCARGEVPELPRLRKMPDDEVIEVLTQVRGIGRWTVEMFLMFRLGRLDILPLDDLGIRKGYAAVYGRSDLPTRAELEQVGARYAPYRSVASYYLWRAAAGQP